MLKFKNTARLAVTAGLCSSMVLGGAPVMALADELQPVPVESSVATQGAEPTEGTEVPEPVESLDPATEPEEPGDPADTDDVVEDVDSVDKKPVVKAPVARAAAAADKAASPEEGAESKASDAPAGYVVDEATGNVAIKDLEAFKHFRDQVNEGNTFAKKTVTLDADIDLNNEEWEPIGNSSNNFMGVFDGQGHIISNLKISGGTNTSAANSDKGLFGYTANGELRNFTLHNANVTGGLDVGAIAGTPYTSKMTNLNLTGDVHVEGFSYVGGMFGKNLYESVSDLIINVNAGSKVVANSGIYRTYVGGLIGFMGEGNITVSNVNSNISVEGSTADVGGLTGLAHYGNKFVNCSVVSPATITVTAADPENLQEIGGLAGVWMNDKMDDVMFQDCTFGGTLSATDNTGKDYTQDIKGNGLSGGAYYAFDSGNAGGQLNIVEGDKTTVVPGSTAGLQGVLEGLQPGQTFKLPAGTYDAFAVPAGVTLEGAGVGKTIIKNTKSAEFKLNGSGITLKNLTVDSTTDGNAVKGEADNLTIDGVEFIGNGKSDSTALFVHERNITIKNSTFKDFNRGYYASGDNHTAGTMIFTGNTFTNVQAPIDGDWDKPADDTTKITFTGNTVSGGVLSIPNGDAKVQGNTFSDGAVIELWDTLSKGAFSKNSISSDSKIVLGDASVEPGDLNNNYWGSADGPAAGQLPQGAKVDTWYVDEDMTRLNTDSKIFKVTFVYGNGQDNEVKEVEDGKTVSEPADPTREGYVFGGWYADADFKTEFDFSAPIKADTSVYAKWVKDEGEPGENNKPGSGDQQKPGEGDKPGAGDQQKPAQPGDKGDGTNSLPSTGDASMFAAAASGFAGLGAIAAAFRRRKVK